MPYSLSQINEAIRSDPKGFADQCDVAFAQKVTMAAEKIARHRSESHVILLSGPSGSGKTTTALKIEEQLENMGIVTHTVSMDNYFNTIDPETAPRNREGNIDYESPFCLDIELLNRHFAMLDRGETIHVPKYEFARQMRSDIMSQPLHLGSDELAIFEGIHALNDIIVGKNPNAFKLYIAARSNLVDDDGKVVFQHAWLRLCRRIVRDFKFRGSGLSPEDVGQRAPGREAVHLPLQGKRGSHVRLVPGLRVCGAQALCGAPAGEDPRRQVRGGGRHARRLPAHRAHGR